MRLTFRDIDHFLVLSKSVNRLQAASSLGVTISALNRAVRRVEAEFCLELVVRHARGTCLTPEGEKFIAVLKGMSAGYSQAARMMAEMRGVRDLDAHGIIGNEAERRDLNA